MAVQSSHELAAGGVPDFDGPVAARRHDVLLVEVDHVHSGSMPDEHPSKVDFRRARHIPDGD